MVVPQATAAFGRRNSLPHLLKGDWDRLLPMRESGTDSSLASDASQQQGGMFFAPRDEDESSVSPSGTAEVQDNVEVLSS